MARGSQVSKMGRFKRKRGSKWGSDAKKVRRLVADSDVKYRTYVPMIGRNVFGFPDKYVTRLRYADQFTLTSILNTYVDNTFRCNSLFDPDYTGIGHQPMYFDQMCGTSGTAPYGKYRVLGAKIKVTFSPQTAASVAGVSLNAPTVVGISMSNNPTSLITGVSSAIEESRSNTAILGDKGGGAVVRTITSTYSPGRDLGLDSGDDTLSAFFSASPAATMFWHVFKIDTTGTSSIVAFVEIDYLVEFFYRNDINQS